jgi:hypothetical protein
MVTMLELLILTVIAYLFIFKAVRDERIIFKRKGFPALILVTDLEKKMFPICSLFGSSPSPLTF